MHLKFITRIEVRPIGSNPGALRELALSKGTGKIDISSKIDDLGHYWVTKLTATLLRDDEALHEPCIMCVWLMDGSYYTIGTYDLPVWPTITEGVLTDLVVEHRSKTRPRLVE